MNTQLLLCACLLAFLYYRLACYKKQITSLNISQHNIFQGMPQRSYFSFFVRCVCLIAAWFSLTMCLAKLDEEPQAKFKALPELATQLPKIDEVAFVLDLSASMGANDTSDGASRLDKAKEIISSMIENLGGIHASLIGFAGNTQTIVPDTLDYLYFRILMESEGTSAMKYAGTNLLAMVDAIKDKYVNSPYKKSVRVVLLTDGEDTGFIDMSDASQKQAEAVLLEHVLAAASDTIQWQVVGLGSDAGAVVPGVSYDDRPVISQMKRELLESIAKNGQGHFYAERDVPLIEICDSLLAGIAGSREDVDHLGQKTSLYAPRVSGEILFLLAAASLFLLAAILLPQYEKRACV